MDHKEREIMSLRIFIASSYCYSLRDRDWWRNQMVIPDLQTDAIFRAYAGLADAGLPGMASSVTLPDMKPTRERRR